MRIAFSRIVKAGMIVGTLDIVAALLHYSIVTGKNPLIVLNFIASGLFGKMAYSAGGVMLFAGLLLHFIIAIAFTLFFFAIFLNTKKLIKNKVIIGTLYGFCMWTVMQFIVLPLSKIPRSPINPVNAIFSILILVVCIGIPLSFLAEKEYKKRRRYEPRRW